MRSAEARGLQLDGPGAALAEAQEGVHEGEAGISGMRGLWEAEVHLRLQGMR